MYSSKILYLHDFSDFIPESIARTGETGLGINETASSIFFVIAEHTNYYANAKSIALEQLQKEQSAADIALTALSGIKPKEKSKRKYIMEYTFPHL